MSAVFDKDKARKKAENEFIKYRGIQDKLYRSDFDKLLENIEK